MTQRLETPEAPRSLGRWNSEGQTWHSHDFAHVHAGGESAGPEHSHIFATDVDTRERLARLLRHAARGPLTAEYRREAAELAALLL